MEIECWSCKEDFHISDGMVGKPVNCPYCNKENKTEIPSSVSKSARPVYRYFFGFLFWIIAIIILFCGQSFAILHLSCLIIGSTLILWAAIADWATTIIEKNIKQ